MGRTEIPTKSIGQKIIKTDLFLSNIANTWKLAGQNHIHQGTHPSRCRDLNCRPFLPPDFGAMDLADEVFFTQNTVSRAYRIGKNDNHILLRDGQRIFKDVLHHIGAFTEA